MTRAILVGGWVALASCARPHRPIEPPPRELRPAPSVPVVRLGPCPEGAVRIAEGVLARGEGRIAVAPFCLDRTEVTVEAYLACVAAEKCRRPHADVSFEGTTARELAYLSSYCNEGRRGREKHPVNCVDHAQAETYCRFVGGRLPTADEWSWAARGRDEARRFPWGNAPPGPTLLNACDAACKAAFAETGREHPTMFDGSDGFAGTAPVGSFPQGASRDGLLDMAGNVFEWTATPAGEASFADRGGAWSNHGEDAIATESDHAFTATFRDGSLGLRCAHDLAR